MTQYFLITNLKKKLELKQKSQLSILSHLKRDPAG